MAYAKGIGTLFLKQVSGKKRKPTFLEQAVWGLSALIKAGFETLWQLDISRSWLTLNVSMRSS